MKNNGNCSKMVRDRVDGEMREYVNVVLGAPPDLEFWETKEARREQDPWDSDRATPSPWETEKVELGFLLNQAAKKAQYKGIGEVMEEAQLPFNTVAGLCAQGCIKSYARMIGTERGVSQIYACTDEISIIPKGSGPPVGAEVKFTLYYHKKTPKAVPEVSGEKGLI